MTKPNKSALIFGVSGQDGAYLSELLLQKGYDVHGTSRDSETASFSGLKALGIRDRITVHSTAPNDFRSVVQTISRVSPDEIYNLSGQSSVGLSFQQPVETLESIATGTLNILEAVRFLDCPTRFYNAASSECFGDTGQVGANESTLFRPKSPYAVAKAAAFWSVATYRQSYDLFACSGILFNHESPLRHPRFVTRKIAASVARAALGGKEKLVLGDLSVRRDWGWAPEYVEAMWLMLQQDSPQDIVIATGQVHSLEAFVAAAFGEVGLDWRDFVTQDEAFFRPAEIRSGYGDARHARDVLGWTAKTHMPEVASKMVRIEIDRLQSLAGHPPQ
ncbi:MAG: GDP-mannose 4,6-dehydratase [Alphaproteobacteria bacterium]|nr:GDP-mannose 4,6-dehydratase [Alphaproteobacteria bacterium]